MRLRLAAALASMAVFHATATPVPDFSEVPRLVQKFNDSIGHPTGTALAIIQDGQVVHEAYLGYADILGKVPVNRDTGFYIASVTKPFLALNTLLLEDRGILDTDTSLQALFPAATFDGFDAGVISVRDLLTHTSGVDNRPLVWATAFSGIHDADSRRKLVEQSYRDDRADRGMFRYTNVGYNILSVWLDDRLGTPWQQQLDENIFSPLGMSRTTSHISKAHEAGWTLAKPYSVHSVNRSEPLYLTKADVTMHAAGGLVSTAPDLARFVMVQLAQGQLDGVQVLPASAVSKSQTQQTPTDGAGFHDFERRGYAWGWYVGEYKGKRMLHHFGGFAGFHAHVSFMPEAGAGLVVLSNEDFLAAHVANLIADHAYGLVLGEPGISGKVSARYQRLLQKAGELETMIGRQQEKIRSRTWDLSLPLQAYVGTYSHPLLGDLVVSLDANKEPVLSWGRLSARATPYDARDHARVEFVPNSGRVVVFAVAEGTVRGVEFDSMTFRKREKAGIR